MIRNPHVWKCIAISLLLFPFLTYASSSTPTTTKPISKKTPKVVTTPATQTVQGIIVVPPHTLYSQKAYIQTDTGKTFELYNSKGNFPSLAFGSYVEANGVIVAGSEPSRLKVASQEKVHVTSSGQAPVFTKTILEELDPARSLSLIKVEGLITRFSVKSLQLTDGDAQAAIKQMQSGKLFPKSFAKGSRISAIGILKYESNAPVIYIPDLQHIEILASATSTSSMRASTSENVIEASADSGNFTQWYVVFAVPIALIAGFAVKKYVVPRFG